MTTGTTAGATDRLIVVGSGSAGCTAAIYAARAGSAPQGITGSVTHGDALVNTTEVENVPGFPSGIQGPELVAGPSERAEHFGTLVDDDAATADLNGHLEEVTALEETDSMTTALEETTHA